MNEAACRWEPHRLAAVGAADAAGAVLAVVPPDEVVLQQQAAPEQLRDLPPGSIQMPFLPCPALPVVKPAGAAAAEQALAVAAGAVRPHLRDRNLQQVACSF